MFGMVEGIRGVEKDLFIVLDRLFKIIFLAVIFRSTNCSKHEVILAPVSRGLVFLITDVSKFLSRGNCERSELVFIQEGEH